MIKLIPLETKNWLKKSRIQVYVETKYQETNFQRRGGEVVFDLWAQLSCELKAINVSNFSSEILSQKKAFSNHNYHMSFYVHHYLIWCEAKKNHVCCWYVWLLELPAFCFCTFWLYTSTTITLRVMFLLISQIEEMKDTMVISQGTSVLLFPSVDPPLYCTIAAKPQIMTRAESSDHPGCSCNIHHRTEAVKNQINDR